MAPFNCEPLLNLLSTYAVGFAVPDGKGHFDHLGSGTLVQIDGLHGILTAKHVLAKLPPAGEIRVALFRNSDFAQFPVLELGHTDRTVHDSADIGFLLLPPPFVSTLKGAKTFKPLGSDEVKTPDLPRLAFLLGAPDEWTKHEYLPNRQRRQFSLLGTAGKMIENGRHSGQVFTFEPTMSPDKTPPKSYGGVSGGGVWLCFIDKDHTVDLDRRLMGVAFEQRTLDDGTVVIDCCGPDILYRDLLEEVRRKFSVKT